MLKITRQAFTLIESLIVILLIGIFSVMAAKPLIQGYLAYGTSVNTLDADAQVRYAVQRIIRELQSAGNITSANANSITFNDSSNHSVTFSVSGTTLQRRDVNGLGTAQSLAGNVSSIAFTYFDKTRAILPTPVSTPSAIIYMTIVINVSYQGFSYPVSFGVFVRNTS